MWEVYIAQSESGDLYTGITNNLDRRMSEHASGKRGAKFFRVSKFEHLVYRDACLDRSDASRREAAIKKLTRHEKLQLIGFVE